MVFAPALTFPLAVLLFDISLVVSIVGCQGVLQLGGLVPVLWQQVPIRYKASKSVLFTNDPSVVKINKPKEKATHLLHLQNFEILLRLCHEFPYESILEGNII